MTMKNGLGIARWTDSQRAFFTDASTNDQSVVYYNGIVYIGRTFATIDYQTDIVFGVTNGDSTTAIRTVVLVTRRIANTSWTCSFRFGETSASFSGEGEATFYGALDTREVETTPVIVEGDTETEIRIVSEGARRTQTVTSESRFRSASSALRSPSLQPRRYRCH